jgi:hypothetical protein
MDRHVILTDRGHHDPGRCAGGRRIAAIHERGRWELVSHEIAVVDRRVPAGVGCDVGLGAPVPVVVEVLAELIVLVHIDRAGHRRPIVEGKGRVGRRAATGHLGDSREPRRRLGRNEVQNPGEAGASLRGPTPDHERRRPAQGPREREAERPLESVVACPLPQMCSPS